MTTQPSRGLQSGTIIVQGRMTAVSGKGDVMVDLVKRLARESRAEEGCLSYDVFRGTHDTDLFVILERWENEELWRLHTYGTVSKSFNFAVAPDIVESGHVTVLEKIA